MADNDDIGRIHRCKCSNTARVTIVPETRRAVGYYKCTECAVGMLLTLLDTEPVCGCGHSVLLHTDKCTTPYCNCAATRGSFK